MPDIVLKDRAGNDKTYSNVNKIAVTDTDGNIIYYTYGGGGGSVSNIYELDLATYTTDHETALATITGQVHGDIAILRAPIDGDADTATKFEYTAYVYYAPEDMPSGETVHWAAMDGNYAVDNVYLHEDITLTTSVGYLESGSTLSKGKSLKNILTSMLSKEILPTVTQPFITSDFNVSATDESSSYDVVGATIIPKAIFTFHPGNYSYGPATGVTASNLVVDGTAAEFGSTITFDEITATDTAVSYDYSCDNTQGTIPVSNLGKEHSELRINAGSITSSTSNKFGYGELTVVKPTISINISALPESDEVGTTYTPTYTITINDATGYYPYGTTVGVKGSQTSAELTLSNQTKTVDGETSSFSGTTSTGNLKEIVITETAGSREITASCTYSDSALVPVSQYGNAVPSAQIKTASISNTANLPVAAGYRQIFWGYSSTKTPTSDIIRALVNHKANSALVDADLAEDTSAKAIIIASPQGTRSNLNVVMPSSSYADVTSQFIQQTVNVEGANNYTAVAYDVWVYSPAIMGGTYRINLD